MIVGCEGDAVEVREEVGESGFGVGREMQGIAGGGVAGERRPGRPVDDEALVVPGEADEVVAVVGELSESVVRALHVVDGGVWDHILVQFPSTIYGGTWRRCSNLTLENPRDDIQTTTTLIITIIVQHHINSIPMLLLHIQIQDSGAFSF